MKVQRVQASADNIRKQYWCQPRRAIEELIWNGLDAGGDRVEVRFEEGALGALTAIEVHDYGTGILPTNLERAFGTIGESLKLKQRETAEGRGLHGSEGRGRFRALRLGERAVWRSTYRLDGVLAATEITIRRKQEDVYSVPDTAVAPASQEGTCVRIELLDDDASELLRPSTREYLSERLAPYLSSYPKVVVQYGTDQLDPSLSIARDDIVELGEGPSGPLGRLRVIEWTVARENRKLMLCDETGFVLHEELLRVQASGMHLSAYLLSPSGRSWQEANKFDLPEMHREIADSMEAARAALREYVLGRRDEEAQSFVARLKKEKSYPYEDGEEVTPVGEAERKTFDILASTISANHRPFREGEAQQRRLTLSLVREALESNPSSLTRILKEVLNLSQGRRDELVELLDETNLSAVISAANVVYSRLRELAGVEHAIFDPDWRKQLLERTQLHRLLVRMPWIFGDEYAVHTDDEPLEAVLRAHLKILGRSELVEEVDWKSVSDPEMIPDMMLASPYRRSADLVEHLVVELKRPSVRAGSDEITQIKKYAYKVAGHERYVDVPVRWKFILVTNDWDKFAKDEVSNSAHPGGVLVKTPELEVVLVRWAGVLHDARARYEFFRDQLNVQVSSSDGFRYLKQAHRELLSGRGLTKKKERELQEE